MILSVFVVKSKSIFKDSNVFFSELVGVDNYIKKQTVSSELLNDFIIKEYLKKKGLKANSSFIQVVEIIDIGYQNLDSRLLIILPLPSYIEMKKQTEVQLQCLTSELSDLNHQLVSNEAAYDSESDYYFTDNYGNLLDEKTAYKAFLTEQENIKKEIDVVQQRIGRINL